MRRPTEPRRRILSILSVVVLIGLGLACRPEVKEETGTGSPPTPPAPAKEVLVFPDQLRVGDEAVNAFVERAMRECASGDYEQFRRLWSAREDPLSRQEYERGWQAVRRIQLRALRMVMLAGGAGESSVDAEKAYALLADVELDPNQPAARGEAHREVVLAIRREQGTWRLARAPKGVRAWLRQRVEPEGTQDAGNGNNP